jgi:hypothetical protein
MEIASPSKMACTSTFAMGSHEEDLADATTTATSTHDAQPRQRRRHSFFIPRRKSISQHLMDGEEGLLLKVRFLRDSPLTTVLSCYHRHGSSLLTPLAG